MRKYLAYEAVLLALLFIVWVLGVVSLARLGDLLIVLGVLFLIIAVLSLFGVQVFSGDISVFLPLNKVVTLETIKSKPGITYILAALGLGIIPIVIGVILLQIS